MIICERCRYSDNSPANDMSQKLESYGVNPQHFYKFTPEEQRDLILKTCDESEDPTRACPEGMSLVVVKPEMFPFSNQIERAMAELRGFDIVDSQPFVYTREAYYSMYKRLFTDWFSNFSHGPLLMLTATSMRSRAILFRHNIIGEEDPQKTLNNIENERTNLSIRQNIIRPLIQQLGFETMDKELCSGRCFDPGKVFAMRSAAENLRTFNGLHIPNDKTELNKNFSQLSTIIKPWQTL